MRRGLGNYLRPSGDPHRQRSSLSTYIVCQWLHRVSLGRDVDLQMEEIGSSQLLEGGAPTPVRLSLCNLVRFRSHRAALHCYSSFKFIPGDCSRAIKLIRSLSEAGTPLQPPFEVAGHPTPGHFCTIGEDFRCTDRHEVIPPNENTISPQCLVPISSHVIPRCQQSRATVMGYCSSRSVASV